jgi:hypothetical protein
LFAQAPSVPWVKTGSLKFDYGGRSIYFGGGLDHAEAEMIVQHLQKRLPRAAN